MGQIIDATMPYDRAVIHDQPLSLLTDQMESVYRSKELDFRFFEMILQNYHTRTWSFTDINYNSRVHATDRQDTSKPRYK